MRRIPPLPGVRRALLRRPGAWAPAGLRRAGRWPACVALALLLAATALTPAQAAPLEPLGQYDPGTPGLNAMAAGLDGFAYLGSWGSATRCPALGVRVIDVRDPAAPAPVGVVASYPGTTAEYVAVFRTNGVAFSGNVLLAGIQRCTSQGPEGGLAVWDVSDPTRPGELSYLGVGSGPRGIHELAVGQQGGRTYAYLAVSNSELFDGRGDLRVVDLTDPTRPVEVANWGAWKDAGLPVGYGWQCEPACRGTVPQAFLHSVSLSPDGRTAYLSYWDLGVILLDVSEPTAPRFLGRFAEPAAAEGNTHSVTVAGGGGLALVADETFAPPWGRLRLVDVRDPTAPVQVASFETPESAAGTHGGPELWYSVHNALADDRDSSRAYVAWYGSGVRLVDVSDASAPAELASWVPAADPQVWNATLMDDLVLVGDVNGGLYLLTR